MHAGMSEAKATKLIKKWFYGEDLPMPVAGGDTANPNAASKVESMRYQMEQCLKLIFLSLQVFNSGWSISYS